MFGIRFKSLALGSIIALSSTSTAFAAPLESAIHRPTISGISNSELDDWCGTRIPGRPFPPRPLNESGVILQNSPIRAIGPKQDDPLLPSVNFPLNSTGVGNPGIESNVSLPVLR